MQIIRGKISGAKKIVVYGPEGIGKSTFASQFPDPLFIDTEGSTSNMDVARLPAPTSWNMILEEIHFVKENPDVCRTLVVDTVDWAEQLCISHICAKQQVDGLEGFGYGKGYVYVKEEIGRFLNLLSDLVEIGINVVLTAHAQLRKFEQPDELGAYDRWELKLEKKTCPLVKEWGDALLFVNYKTYSVATDKNGKKHKAQGGKRRMYTSHHPCWDAKNRFGLPEECDFDYGVIAPIFGASVPKNGASVPETLPKRSAGRETAAQTQRPVTADGEAGYSGSEPAPAAPGTPKSPPESRKINRSAPTDPPEKAMTKDPEVIPFAEYTEPTAQARESPKKEPKPAPQEEIPELFRLNDYIPKPLQDLMYPNLVSEEEIMEAVYERGFFPRGTPFKNLPGDFIEGCLIGAWPQVLDVIREIRKSYKIPFDEKK